MINLSRNYQSRITRIADEAKLIWVICLSIIILFTYTITAQLIIMLCLIALSIYGNLKFAGVMNYIKMFLPVIFIIFIFHLFYHDGNTIFTIWFLTATDVGFHFGIFNFLRFINFLLIAIGFFSWSSPLNIATKLATLFGIARNRFFQDLALVFFIALRFMPVLIRERANLRLAMKARGGMVQGGIYKKITMNAKIILPLLSRAIAQTDDVAAALALKGNAGVYFVPEKMKLKMTDIIIIIIGLILTAAVINYV
jgi:energy-coupling factor transporter transmembrane protein EcfT